MNLPDEDFFEGEQLIGFSLTHEEETWTVVLSSAMADFWHKRGKHGFHVARNKIHLNRDTSRHYTLIAHVKPEQTLAFSLSDYWGQIVQVWLNKDPFEDEQFNQTTLLSLSEEKYDLETKNKTTESHTPTRTQPTYFHSSNCVRL